MAARRWEGQIAGVKKHVLLYGLLGGLLIALLKVIEYRYLVVQHSVEIYGGLIALVFAAVGIWLGLKFTQTPDALRETVVVRESEAVAIREVEIPAPSAFVVNTERQAELRITPRELEILELMAAGLSNREIGERVFVSENTVKTHLRRLFEKLGAKRRTQAVQVGKECGLIP